MLIIKLFCKYLGVQALLLRNEVKGKLNIEITTINLIAELQE
jgi:hypothetical protein